LQALQQRVSSKKPDLEILYNSQAEIKRRLKEVMQRILERNGSRLLAVQQNLQLLNPQQVLARGYSMVRNAKGEVVRDSESLMLGESLSLNFAHGSAQVEVKHKSTAS
jgi:exodeoxyribonuclease VII large subunit